MKRALSSDRIDRLIDVVSAGLITIFTFGLPVQSADLSPRSITFFGASWLLFTMCVGTLWTLHREWRSQQDSPNRFEILLHAPFVVSLLLLTVPARRLLALSDTTNRWARRVEFFSALSAYAGALALGIAALTILSWIDEALAPADRATADRELAQSRRRLLTGATILLALQAWLIPRWGGPVLAAWLLFPPWVHAEKVRLERRRRREQSVGFARAPLRVVEPEVAEPSLEEITAPAAPSAPLEDDAIAEAVPIDDAAPEAPTDDSSSELSPIDDSASTAREDDAPTTAATEDPALLSDEKPPAS